MISLPSFSNKFRFLAYSNPNKKISNNKILFISTYMQPKNKPKLLKFTLRLEKVNYSLEKLH